VCAASLLVWVKTDWRELQTYWQIKQAIEVKDSARIHEILREYLRVPDSDAP
jgi:hypothetical protein